MCGRWNPKSQKKTIGNKLFFFKWCLSNKKNRTIFPADDIKTSFAGGILGGGRFIKWMVRRCEALCYHYGVYFFYFLGRPFHALMQKMDKLHFNCDEAAPNAAFLLHTHCPQAIKEPLVAGIGIIMSVSILCDKKNRSMLRMHPPTGKIT